MSVSPGPRVGFGQYWREENEGAQHSPPEHICVPGRLSTYLCFLPCPFNSTYCPLWVSNRHFPPIVARSADSELLEDHAISLLRRLHTTIRWLIRSNSIFEKSRRSPYRLVLHLTRQSGSLSSRLEVVRAMEESISEPDSREICASGHVWWSCWHIAGLRLSKNRS